MTKILFVLKRRISSCTGLCTISSGLLNSATFVADMLDNSPGISTKLVEVADMNGIDKEVTLYRPNIVIIEAVWVAPGNFQALQKLHPTVKWVVRIHNEIPFLANEENTIDWIFKYVTYDNVFISCNSSVANKDFNGLSLRKKSILLPNYYPVSFFRKSKIHRKNTSNTTLLNIGCFGAIRPLKNQLYQAMAAIQYADVKNKHLRFHINGTRIENVGAESSLKNIRALFNNTPTAELVEHEWLTHNNFLSLVATMDLGMQVSYSETFNVVTADLVNFSIPVVVSPEIDWVADRCQADPNSLTDIMSKIDYALNHDYLKVANKTSLWWYSKRSQMAWIKAIMKLK